MPRPDVPMMPDLNWAGFYFLKGRRTRTRTFPGQTGLRPHPHRPRRLRNRDQGTDLHPRRGRPRLPRPHRLRRRLPLGACHSAMADGSLGVIDLDSPHVPRFDRSTARHRVARRRSMCRQATTSACHDPRGDDPPGDPAPVPLLCVGALLCRHRGCNHTSALEPRRHRRAMGAPAARLEPEVHGRLPQGGGAAAAAPRRAAQRPAVGRPARQGGRRRAEASQGLSATIRRRPVPHAPKRCAARRGPHPRPPARSTPASGAAAATTATLPGSRHGHRCRARWWSPRSS